MELSPANLKLVTEPLVVLDVAGVVVAANDAGAGLLGVAPQSLVGQPAVSFPMLDAALESLRRSGCRLADLEAQCPVSLVIGGGTSGISLRMVEVHRVTNGGSFVAALVFRLPAQAIPASSGPAAKTAAPADSEAPEGGGTRNPSAPGRKPRVLVTDDDAMVRTIISAVLRQQGYVVVEAQDGEEALAWWTCVAGGFDLVLLDLHMPRLGGIEVMQRLRVLSPAVKVILLSGSLDETVAALPLKGVRHQQKPFRNEELVEIVRKTLAD
jgi:CheY-like chemotaxis protein